LVVKNFFRRKSNMGSSQNCVRGSSIPPPAPMPMHDSNSKLVFSSEDDDFFDAEDENSIMEEEEEDEVEEEEEKSIVQRIPEIQKGIFF
jgi:hypothetical protein